jgi:hypothetical protein
MNTSQTRINKAKFILGTIARSDAICDRKHGWTQGQGKCVRKKRDIIKKAAIGASALGAIGLLQLHNVEQKVDKYRKNVATSAIEAEKLSYELERKMREDASRRLKKDPKDVTGFEASVYDFKEKGYDRGFSSSDNAASFFGQTPDSKGAVVLLSYADDNRFTTRGQGSYMMANGGAFQQIWGDRDILPFANNISQPESLPPDDLAVAKEERIYSRVPGGGRAKGASEVLKTLSKFEFLRKNVDERGFNPDAVRAAAFVAAQRRMTGKQVDIMSYSNGGNVATETLAILKEMGYRDIKVVNIAGPTFGIFSHDKDSMRTWVSEGDSFYQVSRGLAFQGGNLKLLSNPNIPHGLMEKIDPKNKEHGKEAKANLRAKNSYLLDEQLRREAYSFLNVDHRRSRQLLDELLWRISENKPMEGDLEHLFGKEHDQKMSSFVDLLGKDPKKGREAIREEIEERMLDVWYGGYSPDKVRNAQKRIRKQLETQISP